MVNELLFPSFEIRTAEDLMRWHDELLEITLRLEFERKIIKSVLSNISRLKKDAMKEKELTDASTLELKILTELQKEYKKSLNSCKNILQIIYFTNETISTLIIGENNIKQLKKDELSRHITPLLHGIGWRFEYEAMNYLRRQGYASFLTYGGLLEPFSIDIIAFKPKNIPIKLNLEGFERVDLGSIF